MTKRHPVEPAVCDDVHEPPAHPSATRHPNDLNLYHDVNYHMARHSYETLDPDEEDTVEIPVPLGPVDELRAAFDKLQNVDVDKLAA